MKTASPLLLVVSVVSDKETREPAKFDSAIASAVFAMVLPLASVATTLT